MSRRKSGLNIHGVVLLDKPVGITSNRALQKVRGIFQANKALGRSGCTREKVGCSDGVQVTRWSVVRQQRKQPVRGSSRKRS